MRGIAAVIGTAFLVSILFGIFAPTILEPIGEVVVSNPTVQDSAIDADGMFGGLKQVILIWAPLLVIGSSIVFAVRWYLNREQFVGRVR